MSAYSTPWLRVGVYRCPPDSALWHETNDNIGDRPHVVFPALAVGLVRRGARVVATPNDVVFYRPFETYERSLRDARGDVSLFIAPRRARTCQPRRSAGSTRARSCSPGGSPRRLDDRACSSRRRLRSSSTRALRARAARPAGGRPPAAAAPSSPRRPRTCSLARLDQPLSLGELAGELHVSPFHLTRVFRECTGRTLTAYLHDLRLRAAVERLDADPARRWRAIAADLGYARPSHFTDRFRAAFGVPPRNCAISWKRRARRPVVEPPHAQAATVLAAALALAAPAAARSRASRNPCKVLWQHTGDAGRELRLGRARLDDIDHDGADDVIAGEAVCPAPTTRRGLGPVRPHRRDPAQVRRASPATTTASRSPTPATSTATASTTSSAARRARTATPRATPTSTPAAPARSSTRSPARRRARRSARAVIERGDVNRDGRDDLVIGAAGRAGGGLAYVYSGRTFKLLYTIPPPDATHPFGAGTGTTDDVERRPRPGPDRRRRRRGLRLLRRHGRDALPAAALGGAEAVRHVLPRRRGRRQPRPRPGRLRRRLRRRRQRRGQRLRRRLLRPRRHAAALLDRRGRATDSARAAAPATSTATASTTSPSAPTRTATARRTNTCN